nr:CAP domain-containing protein [Clostridium paraputrificum]
MNKKLKNIVDKAKGITNKIKIDKKVQRILIAGVVAVAITVASGATYYVLNNKDTGKKEIVSSDTIKEDEIKSDDLILAEDENGNLVVKDQEGNVVAEGDEVAKVVEEKKEEGKNIVTQTSDGNIVKVDKVEGNNVQIESGQTVKPTPKPPVIADNNNNNNNKPNTGTDKPSTDNSGNSNNDNNSNNNNSNNSGTNKPNTDNNNGNSNNGGSTSKPEEPSKPTPPVEQPKPEEKPEVKPEPPKRTWTYMADMSRETFNLMNKFRKDNGVAELKWSDSEHSRAKKQAEYNAKTNTGNHDYMQISIAGNRYNSASGFINGWASSPGHKANMLDDTNTEGAVAVYKDNEGRYFVVASFYDGW